MFEKTKKTSGKSTTKVKQEANNTSIDVDVITDDDIKVADNGSSSRNDSKSAVDYLKEELRERAAENEKFQANIQAERQRLAAARAAAKEKNLLRKIKVVDNAVSKKEITRDEQMLQEFKQAEQKKIADARSKRSKEIAKQNKKPIAALLSGLLVAGCAAGGFVNHSHNVALAENYGQAVAYIMEEEYDDAKDMLLDMDFNDSEALYHYAYEQSMIENYKGKPEKMLEAISSIEGLENEEVGQQQTGAIEEIQLADEIQDDIDALELTSVESISKETISEIETLEPKLEKRYAVLLDTEKYDIAIRVLYNIENNTAAGKLINDLDELGDITLDSKDEIDLLRDAYDSLSNNDKKTVLNYNILTDAEDKYASLKKEEDARLAAEKKAAEEKAEAERLAAEKAEEEKAAKEAKRKEDESKASYTVYVTKSGDKYHSEGCRYLKSIGGTMTQGEALRRGYLPCSNCIRGYDIPDNY